MVSLRAVVIFAYSIASCAAAFDHVPTPPELDATENEQRALQNRIQEPPQPLFNVQQPLVSYSDLQLFFDYDIPGHVRLRHVQNRFYSDDACTKLINQEFYDYLMVHRSSLTPVTDRDSTRKIRTAVKVNPTAIQSSPIISHGTGEDIISFCTQLILYDPDRPSLVADVVDSLVTVSLDAENRTLTGFVEQDFAQINVEVFECDVNYEPYARKETWTQGSKVRICVRPNQYARQLGIEVYSINQFAMAKGGVADTVVKPEAIVTDALVTDTQLTTYRCVQGEAVCSVTTFVRNDYFGSAGSVSVTGEAWLNYNYGGDEPPVRRNLITVPVEDRHLRLPLSHREAREAGAIFASRDFSTSFDVAPGPTNFRAEAYECDPLNAPLTKPSFIQEGDFVRVCIRPNPEARSRGVFVRQVTSFSFTRQDNRRITQDAVVDGAQDASGGSLLVCNPGDPVCAFKTTLDGDFFLRNGTVIGSGEVILQYGNYEGLPTQQNIRRVKVSLHRNMQTSDPGFAGRSTAEMSFPVYYIPSSARSRQGNKSGVEDKKHWWKDQPVWVRVLYIVAIILLILILLCCCWCVCCLHAMIDRRRVERETEQMEKDEYSDGKPPSSRRTSRSSTSRTSGFGDYMKRVSSRRSRSPRRSSSRKSDSDHDYSGNEGYDQDGSTRRPRSSSRSRRSRRSRRRSRPQSQVSSVPPPSLQDVTQEPLDRLPPSHDELGTPEPEMPPR